MNQWLRSRNDWLFWLAEWAWLMLVWLLLVGKLEWAEAWVGIAASAVAASAATIVNGKNFARFYPEACWIFEAWRLPGHLVSDTALVYAALLEFLFLGRRPAGDIQAVSFNAGEADERSATRRALATIMTTFTS